MTKKLYFYYIRTLLGSTSRYHEKCCFDETARPLTSKRIYIPWMLIWKEQNVSHPLSHCTEKIIIEEYISKIHTTSMELHIEVLIVFVYALQILV